MKAQRLFPEYPPTSIGYVCETQVCLEHDRDFFLLNVRPSKSTSRLVCQNTICNSLGRSAAVSPPSILPSLNFTEADPAPHQALPRDRAARVNLLREGVRTFMTSLCVSKVSCWPTSRRCLSACTIHEQSRYRFIDFAVLSNSKLRHWTRLIDQQRLFVSAVPIMATDVDPSYFGRLIYCGVVLLILTEMQVEVIGLPCYTSVISLPGQIDTLHGYCTNDPN